MRDVNDMDPRYAPPPRKGMSTGAKVGIGCGVLLVLALIAAGLLVYYVQRTFEQLSGGEDAHVEATETFARLADEYPFTPPADGVALPDQAWKFVTVSEQIWRQAGPWADELSRAIEELSGEDNSPGLRAVNAGFRSLARIMQVRLLLADVLQRQQMSAEEYVWVGETLVQAYRALADSTADAVPEANLELARTYQAELAGFHPADGAIGKEFMLLLAENTELSPELWNVFYRP